MKSKYRIIKRKNIKSETGYYYYVVEREAIGMAAFKHEKLESAQKELEKFKRAEELKR